MLDIRVGFGRSRVSRPRTTDGASGLGSGRRAAVSTVRRNTTAPKATTRDGYTQDPTSYVYFTDMHTLVDNVGRLSR